MLKYLISLFKSPKPEPFDTESGYDVAVRREKGRYQNMHIDDALNPPMSSVRRNKD